MQAESGCKRPYIDEDALDKVSGLMTDMNAATLRKLRKLAKDELEHTESLVKHLECEGQFNERGWCVSFEKIPDFEDRKDIGFMELEVVAKYVRYGIPGSGNYSKRQWCPPERDEQSDAIKLLCFPSQVPPRSKFKKVGKWNFGDHGPQTKAALASVWLYWKKPVFTNGVECVHVDCDGEVRSGTLVEAEFEYFTIMGELSRLNPNEDCVLFDKDLVQDVKVGLGGGDDE